MSTVSVLRRRAGARATVLLCFALTAGHSGLPAQQADPLVQQILGETRLDSLVFTVRELSGDVQTTVNDTPQTISTRHIGTPEHAVATAYLKKKLESFGFQPVVQVVDSLVSNVLAVQPGTANPGRTWIIGGHYDDMPSGPLAPGADDNGSGSAVVLEAARILSRYRTNCTVVYALWDSEEANTVGSVYYASQAHAHKDTIAGVINVDMIGYDKDNDGRMEIHSRPQSAQLADTLLSINALYNLGLQPVIYNPGRTNSDHGSFWEWNYNAVWLTESYVGGDFNPGYHITADNISAFNTTYFGNIAKLAIASIATLAGVTGPAGIAGTSDVPTSLALFQNYPNPFNATTVVSWRLPGVSTVRLAVYDVLGREVAVLLDGLQESGRHSVTWNATGLASGVYAYRIQAGSFVQTKKMTLIK